MSAAGTDFLGLHATSAPQGGLTRWLAQEVREAVLDGRLPPAARLPATRTLAADLGVARGVVVEAYQRLVDEGLVSGRPGVGTVVLASEATRTSVAPRAAVAAVPTSNSVPRLPVSTDYWPTRVKYDLSPGVPDLGAFPRAAWLRAERTVLQDMSAADLGYGDPRGNPRLREVLSRWLATSRGVLADRDDIIIVAGVAQSLALLAQTVRAAGETAVAVEDPGSRGARDELLHWGLEPTPVSVDEQGMSVEELDGTGLRVALLTPAHQFPTGVVLSPPRRRALLAWAQSGGLVVEDDYDAEHRYDRKPVRALQPMAPDQVAHTGSTSKTLAPGMRLGWLVPPRRMQADLVAARHASDLGSPALPQLVLAHLLVTGQYDQHLRRVKQRQRQRRDAVLAALSEHLPQTRVAGIAAGLHLLVTLPPEERRDDVDLALAIGRAGVAVHPLSWHRHRPGPPGLVLGYAATPPDQLREAIRLMARALRLTNLG